MNLTFIDANINHAQGRNHLKSLLILLLAATQSMAQSGSLPLFGRGSQDKRCFTPGGGPLKARVKLKFQAGEEVRTQPLILPDGSVVVGSIDHKIYFINPDGTEKTHYQTKAGNNSTPAMGQNGWVYIGSGDGHLYVFSQDGVMQDSVRTNGSIYSAPSVMHSGIVVFGSTDGFIYFVNPDGSLRNSFNAGAPVSNSAVELKDGTIVMPAKDGNVYYLKPDGTLKASYKVGGSPGDIALNIDGGVIVGSSDGTIYYLNADATLKKTAVTHAPDYSRPLVLPSGEVVIGSTDWKLNFLSAAGIVLKQFVTTGKFSGAPMLMLDGQALVTGADDSTAHFLRLDGSEILSIGPLGPLENGQSFLTPASVANDGTVVFGSADGAVYYLETDPGAKACVRDSGRTAHAL
jgi:outer membrane protein assembly factor BamB